MTQCRIDPDTLRCIECGARVSHASVRRLCDRSQGPPVSPFERSAASPTPAPPIVRPAHGPGTELKKLLAKIGIVSSPDCSCNRVAFEMDGWGADECERPERVEYVLAAMRENAARRGLPFLDAAGRLLIRRAIRNARRSA